MPLVVLVLVAAIPSGSRRGRGAARRDDGRPSGAQPTPGDRVPPRHEDGRRAAGGPRRVGRAGGLRRAALNRALRREATLVLDFTPNAVHAGHLRGPARGLLPRAGRRPHGARAVEPRPTRRSCSRPGTTDFAILDIHDLAIARERGLPTRRRRADRRPAARLGDRRATARRSGPRRTSRARRSASPACRRTTPCSTRCCAPAGLRPRRRPPGDDRLRRRARARRRPGRRRDRVLERRGRDARAARRAGADVPRRRLRGAQLSGAGARDDARTSSRTSPGLVQEVVDATQPGLRVRGTDPAAALERTCWRPTRSSTQGRPRAQLDALGARRARLQPPAPAHSRGSSGW